MNKTSLRVRSSRDRSPRKSSEAQFERKIAQILMDLGLYSYHTSERSFMGIPDRYICSGRWIEFKQAAVVNHITPMRLLSKAQKNMLDKFTKYGDDCYICILLQFQDLEPRCVFMKWSEFKANGVWDRDFIWKQGCQEKDWKSMFEYELING